MSATLSTKPDVSQVVRELIKYLETGDAPDGLFAPEVFADVSLPHWRLQADEIEGLLAIRRNGHPWPGQVWVRRVEPTDHGFTLEFEERWVNGGQQWYAREMIRADVIDATIVEFVVYCTGDWDEARQGQHAAEVHLIRP